MNRWMLATLTLFVIGFTALGCSDDPETRSRADTGVEADGDSGDGDSGDPDGDGTDRPLYDGDDPDSYERSSGEVADVFYGDALDVSEERASDARQALESLDKDELEQGFSPDELYEVFNEFALTHFGPANQPLITEYTGDILDFVLDGGWQHVSKNSAAIAFETTLPVRGYVEFGTDEESLEEATEESERYFFNQLHHITGLESETEYFYRLVARGDDGETIVSHTRSFTTASGTDWTAVPGELAGPPYVLSESDTTYYLTEDITADRTALIIENATGVTIDLNGHTVIHGNTFIDGADGTASASASGVFARSSSISNLTIVNGHFAEGHVGSIGGHYNGGLNAVYLGGITDVELAGLSIDYHAIETQGMHLRFLDGRVHIHHNRFTDLGFDVRDRHGIGGGRALYLVADDPEDGGIHDFELNHNLVARTRQVGFSSAPLVRDNEVYVDSWSTNSFALHPESNARMSRNKVFLTGYNPYGFGWAEFDSLIDDNLIQMEGVTTGERRYFEDWGEQDAMAAFRITNYGSGGNERNNLTYRDNVVLGRARGGGIMRGTMFYSDYTIEDTLFEGGYVHVSADDDSLDTSAVVGQGVFGNRDEGHLPIYYKDSTFVSNIANVRFGDAYGRGDSHVFISPTFVQDGDHPDYATFVFDKGFYSEHHDIIDPVFEGGAGHDNVWWRRTGSVSNFTISWTLTIEGDPSAEVVIGDVHGEEVFTGTLDEDGELSTPLRAMTIRPEGWENGNEINNSRDVEEYLHTPHEVTVGGTAQTIEMDAPQTLSF